MVRKDIDPVYHRLLSAPSGTEEYVFSSIQLNDQEKETKRKLKYKWKGTVRPSDLDWNMCPKQYPIDRQIYKPVTTDQEETMDIGRVLHKVYLAKALETPDLLWYEAPNYPQELKEEVKRLLNMDLDEEVEKRKPSFLIYYPKYRLSGEIDLVVNLFKKPVVCDFKFPQKETKKDWNNLLAGKGPFKIPSTKTEAQLCAYALFLNDFNIFSEPVERMGALHKNPYMGNNDHPIVEKYIDFTQEMRDKIITLLDHITLHIRAYNEQTDLECQYPLCKEHLGKPEADE